MFQHYERDLLLRFYILQISYLLEPYTTHGLNTRATSCYIIHLPFPALPVFYGSREV